MPQAPRYSKKGTKIAYAILGVPANIQSEKNLSSEQKKLNERLIFEETSRAR